MRRSLRFLGLLVLALLCAACSPPSRTARYFFGCWEHGASRVIFTEHGLYGLSHKNVVEGGLFAIPTSGQILISRVGATHNLRNLWTIESLSKDRLVVALPDGDRIDLTRAKENPPSDPQVLGLWQSPAGEVNWNFFEFTPSGHFLHLQWRRGRRVVTLGKVSTSKSVLTLGQDSAALAYAATATSLVLKTQDKNQVGRTYTRAETTRNLRKD